MSAVDRGGATNDGRTSEGPPLDGDASSIFGAGGAGFEAASFCSSRCTQAFTNGTPTDCRHCSISALRSACPHRLLTHATTVGRAACLHASIICSWVAAEAAPTNSKTTAAPPKKGAAQIQPLRMPLSPQLWAHRHTSL